MDHEASGRLDLAHEKLADAGDLTPARDARAGRWVVERTTGAWHTVGSLVPEGFGAYARIFHPAYRLVTEPGGADAEPVRWHDGTMRWNREVRWTEVAAANGRVANPAMDWVTITGSERFLHGDTQPGIWDEEPIEGSLPLAQNRALSAILRRHTATPERCWFAIWDGFGGVVVPADGARMMMPNRPMALYGGPITGWVAGQARDRGAQSASLWWPEDRAWCVATDVDLMTTYVGASDTCVEELIAGDELEAMQITRDQPTTWDKDAINPRPG